MDSKYKITTTSGDEFEIMPAASQTLELIKNGVVKAFKVKGEPIEPPTYKVQTAGGGEEELEHDEESVKGDEEAEKKWQEHLDAKRRMSAEIAEKQQKYSITTGLKIQMPADDTWEQIQKWTGVEVPDDPMDKRFHYITTEILRTPADMQNAIIAIMKATYDGVDEETIQSMEDSFRGRVSTVARKAGDSAEGIATEAGEVAT